MKIVKNRSQRRIPGHLIWWGVVFIALLAGIGLGRAGILERLEASWQQVEQRILAQNGSENGPVIFVDMAFENYNQILNQRQEAILQGVFLAAESDFVTAEIRVEERTIPVRIRLQPGESRHLGEDDKWNFEVVTRGGQSLLGLSRLQLVDPADNNWLHEWMFMESLRQEGLPAPRYRFVHLIFNGNDLGIYALQEIFGPMLPTGHEQPPGVVVAYDAEPLWEAMRFFSGDSEGISVDQKSKPIFGDFRYLEVDVPGGRDQVRDEALQADIDQAMTSLRNLQSGDTMASEVFDAQQYGRFLALVDLWGATNSLTPFNLAYYYHPLKKRLEPIARNGNPLASGARIPPQATFQDTAVQTAYVMAVDEFSDPAYLDDLKRVLGPQAESLAGVLGREEELELLWDDLAQRQEQLALSLSPGQPVLAHLDSPDLIQEAILQVKVANVINLPVEVLGFDIDGATFLDVDREWLVDEQGQVFPDDERVILHPASENGRFGLSFVSFNLPVKEIIKRDRELEFLGKINIKVATRLLGLENAQMTPARGSLPGASDGS